MDVYSTVLSNIKKKVEKLITLNQKLLKENTQFVNEKIDLLNIIEAQKLEINKLTEINNLIKFTKTITVNNHETNNTIKSKINELMRDIDKCVEFLKS